MSQRQRRGRRGAVRRVAVGSAALGVSALGLGGLAAPSVAAEPTAIADCANDGLTGRITGFPPDERLYLFVANDGRLAIDGFNIDTDASGAGDTRGLGVAVGSYPAHISAVIYRDTNGNSRWNHDVDDTLYQGETDVTTCPASYTLTPK